MMGTRFLALMFAAAISLFAVDVPLNKAITLHVPFGDFSVVEFPFKITGVNKASFIPKYKIKTSGDRTELDDVNTAGTRGRAGKKRKPKKPSSVSIKRGINTLTLFPKKYGTLSLVVWGHEKHPVMLTIIIDPKIKGEKYYNFVDYDIRKKEAREFEAVPHEKVITKIVRYLFNNKTPKGYTDEVLEQKFDSDGLSFTLQRSIVGDRYRGDTWIVKNRSKSPVALYEEMFYSDGIYAVAPEADRLAPGESARLFIVRRTENAQK